MEKLVLDTSAFIEYIMLRSPYRDKIAKLFDKALAGELDLYISAISISEALYLASRVYSIAGIDKPNEEALNFIEWAKSIAQIVNANKEIALRAGELKKQLRIALADCFVIATSEFVKATPVFRAPEKEMKPVLNEMRKLGVKFIEEIDIK